MPALFHLALGPAVVHPTMIGDLEFYPAVAPARYGRHIGGLFAAQGKHGGGAGMGAEDDSIHGEVEWRVIDLQAMIDIPSDDTRLTVAGRYGYPGLLLTLLSQDAILDYWDYQLRLSQRLTRRDRAVLTVFGSYDVAGDKNDPDDRLVMQFHRAEARLIRRIQSTEFGVALQGGFEKSQFGKDFQVTATRFGPRAWVTTPVSKRVRLHAGVDMLATVGEIEEEDDEPAEGEDVMGSSGFFRDDEEVTVPPPMPGDPMGDAGRGGDGEFGGAFEDEDDGKDTPFDSGFASVAGRNLLGAHAELEIDLTDRWLLQPGLRADAWLTGSEGEGSVDPRLMTSYRLTDAWTVYVAAGTGHQPTTPPIPLPGFSDVALERQLQRSIKTEGGAAWDPGQTLLVEAELYYSYMDDVMLFDLTFDCDGLPEGPLRDECETPLPRGEIEAYGLEIFIKRPSKYRLSGWISYTLGRALGSAGDVSFTPAADVRHVGNLVAQYRLGGGFHVGTRLHARSGKVVRQDRPIDYEPGRPEGPIEVAEQRLPGFFRADAQVSYRWKTYWGSMRVTAEWMNFTLEREPTGLRCEDPDGNELQPCEVDYGPLITIPNLGLRGTF